MCASASLSDWYEGSASRLLVWNEWWINDCIIQSEPGQYAQTEYLKASKLICQCRAISKGKRRREEHCCTYWTYLRRTLLWMYFTHLLSCYSLQRFICLQAYVFVYVWPQSKRAWSLFPAFPHPKKMWLELGLERKRKKEKSWIRQAEWEEQWPSFQKILSNSTGTTTPLENRSHNAASLKSVCLPRSVYLMFLSSLVFNFFHLSSPFFCFSVFFYFHNFLPSFFFCVLLPALMHWTGRG